MGAVHASHFSLLVRVQVLVRFRFWFSFWSRFGVTANRERRTPNAER
jgi:hypothetical protein